MLNTLSLKVYSFYCLLCLQPRKTLKINHLEVNNSPFTGLLAFFNSANFHKSKIIRTFVKKHMTMIKKINISDILPSAGPLPNIHREALAAAETEKAEKRKTAKELADIKWREKQRLKRLKANEDIPVGRTPYAHRKIQEQEAKIELVEAIEEEYKSRTSEMAERSLPYHHGTGELLKMQGTTRGEVVKLMSSLNINLSLQLTKGDTANMLACLLTCNEQQLIALQKNSKIPIAIKIVIKRLLEDSSLGNMETIEKLWDRIFGKANMSLNLPDQAQVAGILPNTPVSREAYILIRETLIGQ